MSDLFKLSISDIKKHYSDLTDNPKDFLLKTIKDLSTDLNVDHSLLDKDINDPALLSEKSFGKQLLSLAEACGYKIIHPDWGILAGRLEIQRIKLQAPETFKDMLLEIPEAFNKEYYDFCLKNADELEKIIVPERDYRFTFFGVRTLEKTYFIKIEDENIITKIYETPQRLYLRVASFIWQGDLTAIKEYYDLLSLGYYTHATPTLSNSGIRKGSLASCFLLSVQDDLKKIGDCVTQCMMISKHMGGVGFDTSNIRHSKIGMFGRSNGIVPMLKVFNDAMKYADQGGGRRKGSATVFLQPWHVDFPDFLELKRQQGSDELRARDLFYSVWCCDLFMHRVAKNEIWSLFCPKKAPGLTETYGAEFEQLYVSYEAKKIYEKQMPAQKLWNELLKTQVETGMPFITHKDTANYTSNQKNLGIIRSSNLCQEIMEVSDEHRISSCNLASICLNMFVSPSLHSGKPNYNFQKLGEVTRHIVRALNNVIDKTYYPLEEPGIQGPIKSTNLKYRPLGIGVQGLAETFMHMGVAWESEEAKDLNREIFACIYYNAVDESSELAKQFESYDGFVGSPASKGLLKPDLMALEMARKKGGEIYSTAGKILEANLSKTYNWSSLRMKIAKNGLRNSLLVALMPTASTAQILGNTESFEPINSNIYARSVLSGNHIVINRYMVEEFQKLGIWNRSMVNFIIKNDGSVQNIPEELSNNVERLRELKKLFKTAFEIKQKTIVDLSVDRSFYICQSQSLNIHIKNPTFPQLTSLHFYAWEKCLSTGMYYLRTEPAVDAVKFTVEGEIDIKKKAVCNEEICVTCQS